MSTPHHLKVGDHVSVTEGPETGRTGVVVAWTETDTTGVKFDNGGRADWDDGYTFERIG